MDINSYLLKAKWLILTSPRDKARGLFNYIFFEPEANNCFSIIAWVLSNSILNIRFDVETILF